MDLSDSPVQGASFYVLFCAFQVNLRVLHPDLVKIENKVKKVLSVVKYVVF